MTFGDFSRLIDTLVWVRQRSPYYRERLGGLARIDLVPRGELPRFAYKAARVVDE
jgi:hypothetical protein